LIKEQINNEKASKQKLIKENAELEKSLAKLAEEMKSIKQNYDQQVCFSHWSKFE
jgi:hypothetical protein